MSSNPVCRELLFRDTVYKHYYKQKQVSMPWRVDHNPYYVLLSEIMLQQTQVKRVIDYFNAFTLLWPDIHSLAQAPLVDILHQWQGLGYNRRAKFLYNCVKVIATEHNGIIPQDIETLQSLPGIGVYTSAAIMVFAFNKPAIVVETNIRRVIIHWFFEDQDDIEEKYIREKTEEVMDKDNARIWYWALMDYGAFLSKHIVNPNRKSKIYRKQSKFEGSNRQIRGAIIKILLSHTKPMSQEQMTSSIITLLNNHLEEKEGNSNTQTRVYTNLNALQDEGFIVCENNKYHIAK